MSAVSEKFGTSRKCVRRWKALEFEELRMLRDSSDESDAEITEQEDSDTE